MIPKRIFYCWLSDNPLPDLAHRCIESWKKYCPDYELVKVDKSVFDINSNPFVFEAYNRGVYAIASDVVRFYMLQEGGFYLDLDFELYQSLDVMRDNKAIIPAIQDGCWANHVLGCPAGNLPSVYQEALVLQETKGILPMVHWTSTLNERYHLLGDDYVQHDGIGFYGNAYIKNKPQERTSKAIGKHYESNSWVKGWHPTFGSFVPFVPFNIVRNNVLLKEETKAWYGDEKPIGTLRVSDGIVIDQYFLGKANLFFNPDVVALDGNGYSFRKDSVNKEIHKKRLSNGDILSYVV